MRSSTKVKVRSDSIKPTRAAVKAKGKIIFKVRTLHLDNSILNLKTRLVRSMIKILTILFLPFMLIVFLINGYTIHDKICSTKSMDT